MRCNNFDSFLRKLFFDNGKVFLVCYRMIMLFFNFFVDEDFYEFFERCWMVKRKSYFFRKL